MIGACVAVHRALGVGFREVTYANALEIELEFRDIPYRREVPITLLYRDRSIGEGLMDFVIADELVLENKTVERLVEGHRTQVVSYLRAADLHLGLLVNFHSPRLTDGVKRVIDSRT